jgi:hypothetical protein
MLDALRCLGLAVMRVPPIYTWEKGDAWQIDQGRDHRPATRYVQILVGGRALRVQYGRTPGWERVAFQLEGLVYDNLFTEIVEYFQSNGEKT